MRMFGRDSKLKLNRAVLAVLAGIEDLGQDHASVG